MSSTAATTESRLDRKQQRDIAEARQAGTLPPATDSITGQIINPHNPEFITKRPWYLQDNSNSNNAPTLQHQTVQQNEKDGKRELTLTAAEELLQQQRQNERSTEQQQKFVKGQWVEALKKNKAPYRICQVINVHSNNSNSSSSNTGTQLIDVQYEDGTIETKLKVSRNQNNPSNGKPRVRKTATGNRYLTSSTEAAATATTTGNDAANTGFVDSFVSKRDPYHGYDIHQHNNIIVRKYEQKNSIRRQIREQQQQKETEEKKKLKEKSNEGNNHNKTESGASDASDDSDSDVDKNSDDELSSDDEFVQRDEDDVVLTTRLARQGGVGGAQMKVTARNLRIREDTAKYLYNLNVNSAYYDPKSRSMRDNPFGEMKNDNTDYAGDNFVRISGDAVALAQQQLFAWDATTTLGGGDDTTSGGGGSTNANELHPIANPSQMEILQKTFSSQQEEIRNTMKRNILNKYGGEEYLDGTEGLAAAATVTQIVTPTTTTTAGHTIPLDHKLRFGVSTQAEEYTRDGRLLAVANGNKADAKKRIALESKYEENIFINGHTTVWGSYFHKGAFTWGYDDDHSLIKNSYCTGRNGRMANDEANAMQYGTGQAGSATLEQVRRQMLPPSKRSSTEQHQQAMNRSKLYGEIDPTIALNEQKVQEALVHGKKRDESSSGNNDARWNKKKKYNSNEAEEEMTPEMMEAYRIQKINTANDPMAKFQS